MCIFGRTLLISLLALNYGFVSAEESKQRAQTISAIKTAPKKESPTNNTNPNENALNFTEVKCTTEAIILHPKNPEFRIIAQSGQEIVFQIPDKSITLQGTESKRRSRISEDLATIGIILTGGLDQTKGVGAKPPQPYCVSYAPSFKRSSVKLTSTNKQDGSSRTYQVTAGPAEHWYLSADLPITNIKQLQYDAESGEVTEKEKPASFYMGINYRIGDIFTNYHGHDRYNDLSFKLMLKASKNPGESMGIGISYNLDFAEVFIAQVWTKDNENISGKELGSTDATVAGISFNLTKGLEWLKGE